MALDATVGGASSDSYLSLTDAEAIAAGTLHTDDWDAADDDDKEAALATATRLLDWMIYWCGAVASRTQALAWPRTGMADPLRSDATVPSDILPAQLLQATFAYARAILQVDVLRPTTAGAEGGAIKSVKAGDLGVTYTEGHEASVTRVVPPVVLLLLPESWIEGERQSRM